VREALRQLGASGLIAIEPHRGATVAHVTRAQLEELFVAMGEIEATCARLAAMSMAPLERRRLSALHHHMAALVAAKDREAYAEANVAFHGAIYAGAHNAVIAEMATGLRRRLLPYRRAQFRAAGRLSLSHAEHGEVVRTILAGDVAGAHSAMLHHVNLVEDAFEQVSVALRNPGRGG
jgi:DNA-binding GntR family transcriptional regulator